MPLVPINIGLSDASSSALEDDTDINFAAGELESSAVQNPTTSTAGMGTAVASPSPSPALGVAAGTLSTSTILIVAAVLVVGYLVVTKTKL